MLTDEGFLSLSSPRIGTCQNPELQSNVDTLCGKFSKILFKFDLQSIAFQAARSIITVLNLEIF